jgi:hypothetical protein
MEKIEQLKRDARDTAIYTNGMVELKFHLDAVNYYINKAHKVVLEEVRSGLVAESTIGEHTMVVFDDIIKNL